ncbi:MAG: TaqI-like C-terminal specificity domain-containing protein [Thiofilum sp.]|uniref:Eco57I restriction-modification methylase domain-containing protein n=1 Tax=Thiofilum sp. TaxID=2212733 RepID=UPI0025F5E91A|nr:TaqI-like C-terminal specificity domain-containing protein [Thiofilum sp.]MBK8451749.1 N-6 DNA methylase [Thiofilum sp.]
MSTPPLFHPRALQKALKSASILKDGAIPAKHLKLLEGWHKVITDGSIHNLSELSLQANVSSSLCEGVLGYSSFTNRHKKTGVWTLANEKTIKGIGRVDLGFGKFTQESQRLIAPFELKSPKTTNMDIPLLGRKLSTVDQAAKYAQNSEGQAQWFLVSNCLEIRLYKYPYSDSVYQRWLIADLIKPEVYETFILLLSADYLLSGKTQKLFEASLQVEKDITNQLYTDYRHIRVKLINGMKRENNRIRRESMVARAQMLLDRVLFIAYAEDCGLLPERTLVTYLNTGGVISAWDMLKLLFKYIDQGNKDKHIPKYNGDLFKPNDDLDSLSISDELLAELKILSAYDFATDVSVTILGHIFEQSIADLDQIYEAVTEHDDLELNTQQQGTSGKRKQDGVVYTPDFITQWIVENTLGGYLAKRKASMDAPPDSAAWWLAYRQLLATTRIVDPACGSGAFLVAAFQYLKTEYQTVNTRLAELGEKGDLFGLDLNHDILTNNLFGVDINAESVEIARLSLWLVTAEIGKPLTSLKDNIKQGNSLIADKTLDKRAFSWQGNFKEFDVVLGNPPYVRQERLSAIKPYLEAHYKTYHGVADLYTYFFELGVGLLKKGGMMGFISSSTFFRTGSGENLRRFLQVEANLRSIVNFGDLQIFEGVTTYPAMVVLEKPSGKARKSAPAQAFDFLNITSPNLDALGAELQEASFGSMLQSDLGLEGWRLEDERLQALREKIAKGKPTLKSLNKQPCYGIKTGRNEAFVIDKLTRDQLIKADFKSNEIIKPFLEGKDFKKWHIEPRELYLIFTRRGIDINAYPAIKKHLEQYRTILEPKPSTFKGNNWEGRKAGNYQWYEIQDPVEYYSYFEQPKITYGHFSPNALFSFDTKGYYSNDKSYIIPNADFYLLGLLNSSVHWFLIKALCPAVRGGFHEVRVYYIETLPIPTPTDTQKNTIATLAQTCQTLAEQRYQLQDTLRRQIITLCPKDQDAKLSTKLANWWELDFTDFKAEIKKVFKYALPIKESIDWEQALNRLKTDIETLSLTLATTERELNQAVYELFELTPDEIELLEANLK